VISFIFILRSKIKHNFFCELNKFSDKIFELKLIWKKIMLFITGPTACGKSEIAIELAKKLNGEIISSDSTQVYKFMNIGTCKIKNKKNITHYMLDEIYPDQNFSVCEYQARALRYLDKIKNKNKIAIIVGGTGFYINALLYKNKFNNEQINIKNKLELRNKFNNMTREDLYKKLLEIDCEYINLVDLNNKQKIIRALEYFYQTGKKFSQYNLEQKKNKIRRDALCVIISAPREEIYKNINNRVEKIISSGLLNEVKKLLKFGYDKNLIAMQAIGYKEIIKYLDREISLEQSVELIKKNTRNYAKRQITWFKHQSQAVWLDKNNFKSTHELINYVLELYNKLFTRGN